MRLVIQRVTSASVSIDGNIHSSIERGLLVLAAVEHGDTEADARWLSDKLTAMRIFDDDAGVMNLSVRDVAGEVLCVSQFTLTASTRKGNRPSYIRAAAPPVSQPLYMQFCDMVSHNLGRPVATGVFGADMQVSLVNDGPVTIIIDSHLRE